MSEKRMAPIPTVYRKVAAKVASELVGKSVHSQPLILGQVGPVALLFIGETPLGEARENEEGWASLAPDGLTGQHRELRWAVAALLHYQADAVADALIGVGER